MRQFLFAMAILTACAVGFARGSEAQMLANQAKTMAAGGQFKVGALVIDAPWLRATPSGAKVAGGYLKITNTGTEPDRLVGGTLPIAGSVEVHEMSMAGSVMQMRRVEGLEIKPGASVELKPGGYHLMFMELKEGLKAGDSIKGTLVFEKAGKVDIQYVIAPIGASSPNAKMPGMPGMPHAQH